MEWVLHAEGLNAWDAVFITGNLKSFGNWKADALRMAWRDGAFHLQLPNTECAGLRYLFTRGCWRSAELTDTGCEASPHIVSEGRAVRHHHITSWGRNSVRYHPHMLSQDLPHPHTLTVHVPAGYDLHPQRRYPVMYLQDGQNLFDAHTSFAGVPWACDETAEQLQRCGETRPIIQVGIANTPDRHREYGPSREPQGDLSSAYARFLIEEVKPFIDRHYRTKPTAAHTGIGGSSLGGLFALHCCRNHPDVFGLCSAMSPSLWWDDEHLLQCVQDDPGGLRHVKIWLDMGGREGHSEFGMQANLRRARWLHELLRGENRCGIHYHEEPDGLHQEAAWAGRYADVLRFLVPAGHPD